MKKIAVGMLIAVLAILSVQPVNAEDQRVLAIIDTAIDSSKIPQVIYEACFTQNRSCPGGLSNKEGLGSANAKVWPSVINPANRQVNPTYHGYIMTRIALESNPNIKIVFVRYSDITEQGNSNNQPASLSNAIDWVSNNASKYSIDAVSISQTGSNLTYCSSDTITINAIKSLDKQNIPVFAATGNTSTLQSIKPVGFPACVDRVVGVGAVAALPKTPTLYENFASITNRGLGLDVVAPVDFSITWLEYNATQKYPSNGTSVSTVIAASKYLASNGYTKYYDFQTSLPKVLGYPYISK